MQWMRSIRRDHVAAWLLAALMAYLLAMQGAIGAYARGAMAAHALGPAFIICSPSGENPSLPQHPLADFDKDCCSTACQIACTTGAFAAPETAAGLSAPGAIPSTWTARDVPIPVPARFARSGDARAPPSLSL